MKDNRKKDNRETDQLLNGFIDGVLSAREQTEVKRLIDHDPEIAKRLEELRKCKLLVESMPRSKAPSQILTNVRAKFEAEQSAKGGQIVWPQRQILGTIQLFLRRFLAAAAMFVLLFGLAVMIYRILSPPKQEPKIARTILPQPVSDATLQSSETSLRSTSNRTFADAEAEKASLPANGKTVPEAPADVFAARLELKTKEPLAAQAELRKLLEKNLSSDFVTLPSGADRFIFTLNCSGDKMSALLADFENIWNEFESASLFVETGSFNRIIVIDKITASQLADIASQQNLDRQIKAARYFSIINNPPKADRLTPESRFAAGPPVSRLGEIPEPSLAKDESAKGGLTASQTTPAVHLTIELVSE